MKFKVAITAEVDSDSRKHLLQHYERNILQEDLCFALWRPSTGARRRAALIDEIVLPREGERLLHGNASFEADYLSRAIGMAIRKEAGLAFMHSHPSPGWQELSGADIKAERDVLAYPAGATSLPLVGLTIGTDGYWSARFWERLGEQMHCHWCESIFVVRPRAYTVFFNDRIAPIPRRREILRRTFDTWGREAQETISRLRIGIVGLGSVGCITAEAIARMGVAQATLIDPDKVEEHNLDRLIYGTEQDVGKLKVDLAAEAMRRNKTAESMEISTWPISIHDSSAFKAALECDLIFSCVDRPVPRDVLNYIAHAHLIPVVDGGISVEKDLRRDRLFSAHWRAHLVTPYHQCLRCRNQYNSSSVVTELDGSLDDPSYVANLPPEEKASNQNVFPFSLSLAGLEVNLMMRYLLAPKWWPPVYQQDYQFMTGETSTSIEECHLNCSFRGRRARGDSENPPYLIENTHSKTPDPDTPGLWGFLVKGFGRVFWNR